MTRYIDADALLEKIQYRLPINSVYSDIIAECVKLTGRIVEAQPIVDAVKVVRCKDCENRYTDGCPMHFDEMVSYDDDGWTETDWIEHDRTHDYGFCDRGERRK